MLTLLLQSVITILILLLLKSNTQPVPIIVAQNVRLLFPFLNSHVLRSQGLTCHNPAAAGSRTLLPAI